MNLNEIIGRIGTTRCFIAIPLSSGAVLLSIWFIWNLLDITEISYYLPITLKDMLLWCGVLMLIANNIELGDTS